MARLPHPGGDSGSWGSILNSFLSQAHKPDGTLKDSSVGSAQLQDDAVTSQAIASGAVTTDALAESAVTTETIAESAVVDASIADGTITEAKLTTGLQAKIDTTEIEVAGEGTLEGTRQRINFVGGSNIDVAVADDEGNDRVNITISAQAGNAPAFDSPTSFPSRPDADSYTYLTTHEVGALYSQHHGNTWGVQDVKCETILAETYGPGILTYIWSAFGSDRAAAYERDTRILIYFDDATTPAIDVPISSFYFYENQGGVYSTPYVGRAWRDNDAYYSGSYRYMFAPFKKYCRVAYSNTNTADAYAIALWSQVSITKTGTQYSGDKKLWQFKGDFTPDQEPFAIQTGFDIAGRGQLESAFFGWTLNSSDDSIVEGNFNAFIDNETRSSWRTSGGEDFPSGAFGIVPVGGYPSGMMANSDIGGTGAFYRFFDRDPIYFNSRLKIQHALGQKGQPSGTATGSVDGWIWGSYWLDSYQTPNFKQPDFEAAPLGLDTFSYPAGDLPAPWSSNPTGTKLQASGSQTVTIVSTDGDRWAHRPAAALTGGASDYWVEVETKITGNTDGQEVVLGVKSSAGGTFYLHPTIRFGRSAQYNWYVSLRDDFDEVFLDKIDEGNELTNVWVTLAMQVEGNTVTGYWKFSDDDGSFKPLGRWTTINTSGANISIGAWTGQGEFRNLVVRPVNHIIS